MEALFGDHPVTWKQIPAWSLWALICWNIRFHRLWQEHFPKGAPLFLVPFNYSQYISLISPAMCIREKMCSVISPKMKLHWQLKTGDKDVAIHHLALSNCKYEKYTQIAEVTGQPREGFFWKFRRSLEKGPLLSYIQQALEIFLLIILMVELYLYIRKCNAIAITLQLLNWVGTKIWWLVICCSLTHGTI